MKKILVALLFLAACKKQEQKLNWFQTDLIGAGRACCSVELSTLGYDTVHVNLICLDDNPPGWIRIQNVTNYVVSDKQCK